MMTSVNRRAELFSSGNWLTSKDKPGVALHDSGLSVNFPPLTSQAVLFFF